MKAICLAALLASALLPGCARDNVRPMPGSDRDAHGCIPSAGYLWCARTARCERPWELAEAQSFENTAEAFAAFCGGPQDVR